MSGLNTEEVLMTLACALTSVGKLVRDDPFPETCTQTMDGASVAIRMILKHLIGDSITKDSLLKAVDDGLDEALALHNVTAHETGGSVAAAMHILYNNGLHAEVKHRHSDLQSLGIPEY